MPAPTRTQPHCIFSSDFGTRIAPRFAPRFASVALACAVLWLGAAAHSAHAQNATQPNTPAPRNIVQLSANGSVEVEQDWLILALSVTREDASAAAVQRELQKITDAALRTLRPQAQGEDMQLQSGRFAIYPRYGRNGKISSWQGSADIVLQGRDFPRITQAAASVDGMNIDDLRFELSKTAQDKLQAQAQAQAITNFRQKAQQITELFGKKAYQLREVTIGHDGRPRFMARAVAQEYASVSSMSTKAGGDSLAVQAGKARVEVEISGSIQME